MNHLLYHNQNKRSQRNKKMTADRIIPYQLKDKIKILVVEDNLLNQKLAGFMLTDWGFQYDICANGQLALEKLKFNKYDLVLMDIQIPELNGYETTHEIRETLNLSLPIIAMTAYALSGEKEKCLSAGMTDYISKPINEAELYGRIEKYLCLNVVNTEKI